MMVNEVEGEYVLSGSKMGKFMREFGVGNNANRIGNM